MRTPATPEDFGQRVIFYRSSKDLSPTEAIYHAIDDFSANVRDLPGHAVACTKGCTHCCYMNVSMTKPEGDAILDYLEKNPEVFTKLRDQLYDSIRAWEAYETYRPNWRDDRSIMSRDWVDQPCPFLNQTSRECQVYEARPLACRGYSSEHQCTSVYDTPNEPRIYDWYRWASIMLNVDDVKRRRQPEILSLRVWIRDAFKDRL